MTITRSNLTKQTERKSAEMKKGKCKMYKYGEPVKGYKDGGKIPKPAKKPEMTKEEKADKKMVDSANRVSKMEAEAAKAMKKKK